ncbi:MAG: hypothetical protein M1418_08250 [Deltaproteobacteria bacterium]|nr:hypothetical protein [Deltaproteobacteria bacterium]
MRGGIRNTTTRYKLQMDPIILEMQNEGGKSAKHNMAFRGVLLESAMGTILHQRVIRRRQGDTV